MTTSKDPQYASNYALCDCRLHHHPMFSVAAANKRRQSQTDPDRGMRSHSFYIREIKDWDETCLIMGHNLPHCITLLCCFMRIKLCPTHATNIKPYTDLCSTMTWPHILKQRLCANDIALTLVQIARNILGQFFMTLCAA